MMTRLVAVLGLAGPLALAGAAPAPAADPAGQPPDVVFVAVPLLRGELLRVCVRHVAGRPSCRRCGSST